LTQRSVSVVIPAYNEEKLIAKCLESIIQTKYPLLEIIVVDDCSTDRTVQAASKYNLTLVKRVHRGGIAAARNDGIKVARSEVVAFVDADCTVELDWLDLLTSHFVDANVAGAGGIIGAKHSGLTATYRSFRERESWSDAQTPTHVMFLPGGNSCYLTRVLREIGGFDSAFARPRGHEALEIGHRLRKRGFVLIGDPRAVVWHGHEDSLRSWAQTTFGLGYSAISFLFRRRFLDFPAMQLKQIAFILLVILCLMGFAGLVPVLIPAVAVGIFAGFELLSAGLSITRAVVHYKNPKYALMLPVEIAIRVCLFAGYAAGLITAPFTLRDLDRRTRRENEASVVQVVRMAQLKGNDSRFSDPPR
jgi:GT2 family glycosyltransferase